MPEMFENIGSPTGLEHVPGDLMTMAKAAYPYVDAGMNTAYRLGQYLPPNCNPLGPLAAIPSAWVQAQKAYQAYNDPMTWNMARAGGLAGALETSSPDLSGLGVQPQPIVETMGQWPPPMAPYDPLSGPMQSVALPSASLDPSLALGGEEWASGWAE